MEVSCFGDGRGELREVAAGGRDEAECGGGDGGFELCAVESLGEGAGALFGCEEGLDVGDRVVCCGHRFKNIDHDGCHSVRIYAC